uniref:Putative ovule protein n=1 Tax=Solanum chacoense TaxID=4108 RepID=A0A0V0H6P1_SOLCH
MGLNFEQRERKYKRFFFKSKSYLEKRIPKRGLISRLQGQFFSLACTPYHPGCPSYIYVSS